MVHGKSSKASSSATTTSLDIHCSLLEKNYQWFVLLQEIGYDNDSAKTSMKIMKYPLDHHCEHTSKEKGCHAGSLDRCHMTQ